MKTSKKEIEILSYFHASFYYKIWTSTRRRAHHTAWPFLSAAHSSLNAQIPLINPTGPITTAPESFSSDFSPPGSPPTIPIFLDSTPDSSAPVQSGSTSTTNKKLPPMPSKIKVVEKPQMLEINPGIWDGLSPEQAKKYYPEDWDRFTKDPYSFRAPRAESYHDLSGMHFIINEQTMISFNIPFLLLVRLEPILIELEREQEDLFIIGHASVIRCLLAYLIGLPASEIPAIEIARGDLLEVVPASYGVHSRAFHFWDGPGRSGDCGGGGDVDVRDANNFYENYAESTKGKRKIEDFDGHFQVGGATATIDQLSKVVSSASINKGGGGGS